VQIESSIQKPVPQEEVKLNTTGTRTKETYMLEPKAGSSRRGKSSTQLAQEQKRHTKSHKA